MYEDLRALEIHLHDRIRDSLVGAYGADEQGWWRLGIPQAVRVKCQERRETDSETPVEPYRYTDLIDLSKVIENQWSLLKGLFPEPYRSDRRQLIHDLNRLNQLRNRVMHPVRGAAPSEEDFELVRDVQSRLGIDYHG